MAGAGEVEMAAETVAALKQAACRRYGPEFCAQAERATIAVNGVEVGRRDLAHVTLNRDDEVAFLPPVSGGRSIRT